MVGGSIRYEHGAVVGVFLILPGNVGADQVAHGVDGRVRDFVEHAGPSAFAVHEKPFAKPMS